MSTAYYRLREPITSLRLEEGSAHDVLTVWESGAWAGTLTLSKGASRAVARMFFVTDVDDVRAALHTYYRGAKHGCVVTVNDETLPDSAIVLGEDGEMLTVREVKAFAGQGRRE